MDGDFHVRVTQRLEEADLAAFQRDDAAQHHVHEEGADPEEDGRQDEGGGAELRDLGVEEGVRLLFGAVVGAEAAVGLKEVVEPVDHGRRVGAAGRARGSRS